MGQTRLAAPPPATAGGRGDAERDSPGGGDDVEE